ncbi:MAG: DUF262 domain-containing HNH endonuclease family protein [Hyphomicrobiales bacterium]|nr:DUF262 domain-containing HNH endonuclease family protein [Hyphomicrobiales bacterium]
MPRSISCEVVTLGRLIRSTDSFLVPPFQRNYAWGEKQYSAFWEDLTGAFNGEGEIFIGASVLKPSAAANGLRQLVVIDGQQRLTTAAVLLSALRHHLRAQGCDALAQRIETEFLRGVNAETGQPGPRFTLNTANKNTFDDHIYGLSAIRSVHDQKKGKRSSNTNALLLGCFMFMHKKIGRALRGNGLTIEEFAEKILAALDERVTLIHIGVADDRNAFVLFETLNERGLELSQCDIVKNYLLTLAGANASAALAAWDAVEDNLRDQSVSDFLRIHWSSRGEAAAEKHLFDEIKSTVGDGRAAIDYLESLRRSSEHGAALLEPAHPFWRRFPDAERAAMTACAQAFRSLSVSQPFTLLLAALDATREERAAAQTARLMRAVVAFTVRYTTICGLAPSRAAAAYVKAAAQVRRSSEVDADALCARFFAPLCPDDAAFAADFRNKKSKDNAVSRYLLRMLNDALSPMESGGEAAPDQLSIDHILPLNPSLAWLPAKRKFKGGFEAHVHRLGNMTLLSPSENQLLGNKGFAEKKTIYRGASVAITRALADMEHWTPKEIDLRQKWMAALAVKVWPALAP